MMLNFNAFACLFCQLPSLEAELKRPTIHSIASPFESGSIASNKENCVIAPTSSIGQHVERPQKNDNSVLMGELLQVRYLSVMQPTFDLFSCLRALTLEVPPETPHEEWFQRTLGPVSLFSLCSLDLLSRFASNEASSTSMHPFSIVGFTDDDFDLSYVVMH